MLQSSVAKPKGLIQLKRLTKYTPFILFAAAVLFLRYLAQQSVHNILHVAPPPVDPVKGEVDAGFVHIFEGRKLRPESTQQEDDKRESPEGELATVSQPQVCFVIRTYWAHGPRGSGGLQRMLEFIKASKLTRWEALLIVLDERPFLDLHQVLLNLSDARARVFLEETGPDHAARMADNTNWRSEYHAMLYNITDQAIAACMSNTSWVVVTNGDNVYDAGFVDTLLGTPLDVGIIAYDFYSRYQRPTAGPCVRFAAGSGLPPCKENGLRFCQTDLAANVLNWRRLMTERRTFGAMDSGGLGLNDGLLMQALQTDGWKVRRHSQRCLIAHMPNPQLCALQGGVWNDTDYDSFGNSGGACVTMAAAALQAHMQPTKYEMIQLELTHDADAFEEQSGGQLVVDVAHRRTTLQGHCLRAVQHANHPWVNTFFPAACTAPIDEVLAHAAAHQAHADLLLQAD